MNDLPKQPAVPDPANELASDNSPIDPRDFRSALGTYATGVTIITAAAPDGKPYGLTCNSFASVSLNPPLVLWSLVVYSSSLTIFQNASHFTVNVLGVSQQALASKFAKSSDDKFTGVDWTPGLGNAPVLAESVANFQCRSVNRYYGGDHVIFLGAVEAYTYNAKEPLLFARGAFGRFLADG
ncbi:flavin reductase family protein [Bradyrhizobium sp. 24]|jgi:flavin reductase (DIM6/NTAB) family NADH-FMN oxidoreductase RutF|uniref:flavin reductase family protein n=1 Tax=unclassified Bradyrhizobium TaxID=2631580 RepID=UPI001FF7C250|nr:MULTISPECIES: flavin reductase family protein [unclassified Bradyrhizobium]MCK1380260.1 flavin reductase family protein [Bradyrhizobium sp. 24]MCK1303525.1 flavin reductase family protein [Bradyrhizobium sp. 37]MCK1408034.1 flavin reductase family protein [Bradyrhizobium sp. 76]MCK1770600.1 flavin reductase family protein [Bradyrhizobium sp. 134]UPJ44508.1 flavin reductase family protein [Bradyrhizobium sp. 40]